MGFFYRPAGGDANEPTYPTSPLTVAADASGTSFVLTNSGTTPASVELSFSSDTGSASLLIGSDYDQGTDRSPTYVVDPDTGTRTVNLIRGSLAPSDPSSTETVTLTSNAGVLPQTITCTVIPVARFDLAVREIATPTFEMLFANTTNTGSIGGSFTASNYSLTADTGDYAGFDGYGVPTTATGEVFINSSSSNWGKISGTTRTWIYAWTNTATLSPGNSVFIWADDPYGARNAGGQISSHNPIRATDGVGGNLYFNTTHSNCATDGTTITPGASESMLPTTNALTVLACTWNGSNSVTYRWKQAGHGSGFSLGDITRAATTPFTWDYHIVGTRVGTGLKFRYAAVIDSDITNAQFLDLLNTAGL